MVSLIFHCIPIMNVIMEEGEDTAFICKKNNMATREIHRITGSIKRDYSYKSNTEAGMSKKQADAVLGVENNIRNRKTEVAYVVDADGNINPEGSPMVGSGSSSRARVNLSKIPENSVIVHNHPMIKGATGLGRDVGVSLSGSDIRSAIRTNAKEIRAVSENYVYSIKRPAGGWNVHYTVGNVINDAIKWRADDMVKDLRRRGVVTKANESLYVGRVNALASHTVIREYAKKYGWTYTRRKSN